MGFLSKILPAAAGAGLGWVAGGPAGAALGISNGEKWGAGLGAGAGLLMGSGSRGAFGSGGGGYVNPEEAAAPYLDRIPSTVKPYLDPFVIEGNMARGRLPGLYNRFYDEKTGAMPEYEGMAKNPQLFLDKILEGYRPSRGFQYRQEQLNKSLGNTAAAGGYAGTDFDQNERARMLDSLINEDMQTYLANVLGIQTEGLRGRERGLASRLAGEETLAERGYDASSSLADTLGNALSSRAGLGFQGRQQGNINRQERRNNLFSMLSNLAGTGTSIYGLSKLPSR